jgi:hypothetical protein
MSALEDQPGNGSVSSLRLQRRWVADRLPQITVYLVLRREIQLLEQFRRDRNTASSPDFPECSLRIMSAFEMLMVSIAVWACLAVNVERNGVRGCGITIAEVLLQRSTQVWRRCSKVVIVVRAIRQICVVFAHTISIDFGAGEVFVV